MTLLACSLAPEVRNYAPIARLLAAEAEANRKLSYPELARLVLTEAGVPLHWREIVARAEALGRKENVAAASMMHVLQENRIFVRTSSGTYGLREWGLQTKQPNTTLVAEFLAAKGRPASFGEILQKVGTPAKIRPHSLKMALDLSPRFYRSVEDEYGLRAWLPPRDMQRLSTPRWKVEAADSFARVERAGERGYDVEAMVLRDMERGAARE
jgi:hypothetical protein